MKSNAAAGNRRAETAEQSAIRKRRKYQFSERGAHHETVIRFSFGQVVAASMKPLPGS